MKVRIPEEEEGNQPEYIREYWLGAKDFQKRTPRPAPWGPAYQAGYYAGLKAAINWEPSRRKR